ncbi:MAG: hypothetical protein P0Y53_08675 [Candidatus Pseudobacter hemicellulosilyticus]|uniref:Uncharacterized protein n=1 Tax=Candidatus Pseudobacter hemicellulosilyticus TaxID=3121375 RepID=A0AAJ5X000_9BACT|nr:MAG: hypothetical protein P0Y53_08675 [Pseudobacter sp.]
MQRSSNNLPYRSTIFRSLIASCLLAVFALGITPKLALHHLLAHHTDSVVSIEHSHTDQLSATGYSCELDQLVAESAFTPAAAIVLPALLMVPQAQDSPFFTSFYSQPHFYTGLRGPPAIS